MKKTQIKDTIRNIRKQLVSYLSVIVIALLGVSIFLGLDYSSVFIRKNASDYFSAQQVRDIELVSTLLFSQDDLAEIRSTEGVIDAEGVLQVRGLASSGGDRVEIDVISLTERLNLPQLAEGRLPETETECAAERKLAEEMGWSVGDEIFLRDAQGSALQYLKGERFTLTGIADHPDHNNTMVAGVRYVMVRPETFDADALNGCCMKVEVAIGKEPGLDRYSDAYRTAVSAVMDRLEALAIDAGARRDVEVREQIRTEIEEGQTAWDDAQAELTEGRRKLDEGWAAYTEGEQQLADAKTRLEESAQQLADAKSELDEAQRQLADAKAQLEDAKTQLDEGEAQLAGPRAMLYDGWNELEAAKEQIRAGIRGAVESVIGNSAGQIAWAGRQSVDVDAGPATAMEFWITTGYCCDLNQSLSANINGFIYSGQISDEMLREAYIEVTGSEEGFDAGAARAALAAAACSAAGAYEGDYRALQSACRQWDEGDERYWYNGALVYLENLEKYRDGLAEYEAGLAEYEAGLAEYEAGEARYEQGAADFEDGQKKLDESRTRLEDGEKDYEDGMARLNDGERKLLKARKQLEQLEPCRWLVFDMNSNAGYVQIDMAGDNLKSLESTFATLFILVGALVIFATVSKMIDEQRTQVGTTKALGFFNREVFAKYLCFGVTAAALGAALGALAARYVLESITLNGYEKNYTYALTRPGFTALPTLAVLLTAAALAVLAVWAASARLLRTPAIRLMQPKVPVGAKKSGGNGKHTLSLYFRLILLNMRVDIKRVIVTIVSVAGCCALIVIAVTIKTAMQGSLDRQYDSIVDYDWRVNFSPEESETAEAEITALLDGAGADYTLLYRAETTYSLNGLQTAELFCGDLDAIGRLYHLQDPKSGEALAATDAGVLIQKRVSEAYGLSPGSKFELALDGVKTTAVSVAGVFEHYIGRPMFMSPACFERVFGEPAVPNAFFVRLNGADADALEAALRGIRGFSGITPANEGKTLFEASTGVINMLVALFVFMAAVMAGIVLMNLTNIYVLQKKRELTIMRVNGFTVKEVVDYMLRETLLTTALGILLGLAVGSGIAYTICRTMDQPFLQLVRDPSIPAWITGAVLTVLFTAVVNYVALRPVKNLKLTDVA